MEIENGPEYVYRYPCSDQEFEEIESAMLDAYKDNLRMALTGMSKYVYAERLKSERKWNRENKHWVAIYHKESGKLAGIFKFIVGEPLEDTAYPEDIHYDEGYNKLLALEI